MPIERRILLTPKKPSADSEIVLGKAPEPEPPKKVAVVKRATKKETEQYAHTHTLSSTFYAPLWPIPPVAPIPPIPPFGSVATIDEFIAIAGMAVKKGAIRCAGCGKVSNFDASYEEKNIRCLNCNRMVTFKQFQEEQS